MLPSDRLPNPPVWVPRQHPCIDRPATPRNATQSTTPTRTTQRRPAVPGCRCKPPPFGPNIIIEANAFSLTNPGVFWSGPYDDAEYDWDDEDGIWITRDAVRIAGPFDIEAQGVEFLLTDRNLISGPYILVGVGAWNPCLAVKDYGIPSSIPLPP